MLNSLILLAFIAPHDAPQESEIPVESVVVSLIDHVDLAFGEAGIVREIHFQPGMTVQKGDLLAQLNSTDSELQLQRVQAELDMAKLNAENDLRVQLGQKSLALATAELQRALRSNEKFAETVSASEIERLTLARDEAALQIEQARHDLEYSRLQVRLKEAEVAIARHQLERRQLHSPLSGTVVKVDLQIGEWAQPDQAFWRIIRTNRVRAEGFVDAQHGDVDVGQPVSVELTDSRTGKGHSFDGTVTFVDPEIDSITGQYRIWAEIDNPNGRLRPGHHPVMRVKQVQSSSAADNNRSLQK